MTSFAVAGASAIEDVHDLPFAAAEFGMQ